MIQFFQIWALIWHSLFAQSLPFPGPGSYPAVTPTWTFDNKNFNGLCAGSCSSINVTYGSGSTGKYIRIWVFSCGDGSCSTDPLVGRISSIASNGTDTISFDGYSGAFSGAKNYAIWAYHITSGTGDASLITVNFSPNASFAGIFWSSYNYSAGAPVTDQQANNVGTSDTTLTVTTAGNLAQTNELITAMCVGDNATTVGSTFNALNAGVSNVKDEYKISGTAGMTATADCTQSPAGRWHIYIATTKL